MLLGAKLVVLLDVSGSTKLYSRYIGTVNLAGLAALARTDRGE